MTHQRNIRGLLDSAKEKRNDAIKRVTRIINELDQNSQSISFSYIAKASGVSKAWIYRQKDICVRINELRLKQQSFQVKKRPITEVKSTIVCSLKERIKKLETENTILRKQLEVMYGKLHIENEI